MKKILVISITLLLFTFSVFAQPVLKGTDYANDFANVLSSETINLINKTGAAFEKTDNTQIVVVTIDSLEGQSIEDYAYDLFNDWGIGSKKEDNGMLILLSVGDREIRIETGGGMEGIFNDAKVGRMIDSYAIPYFAENDFDTGIKNLYTRIVDVIGNPDAYEDETTDVRETFGTIALVLVLIILSVLTGGRGPGGRRRWGGFGGFGGYGGFGGGSTGGGFGGFGGGSSSGGGASRKF